MLDKIDKAYSALAWIQEIVQTMHDDLTDGEDFDTTSYAANLDLAIREVATVLNSFED